MKKLISFVVIVILLFACVFGLSAQQSGGEKIVVATTSWTAAFVKAAGFAGKIHTLAPVTLQHPPEYELKPSDIAIAAEADFIVFAGYERMAAQLKDTAAKKTVVMLQITTDYSLNTLKGSVRKLAAAFGTSETAEENIARFETFFEGFKAELKTAGVYGGDIICHAMQIPFLKELGFSLKGTYGPAPLEPKQLGNLSGLKPALIIDNWHNQIAKPLKDLYPKTPVPVFINFPGQGGTDTLLDVLQYNTKELLRALGR